jgi:hypothetical protein
MSVGTLLAPQTELQPWSNLYANQLNVENLVAAGLTLEGDLNMNGHNIIGADNITATGTITGGTVTGSAISGGSISGTSLAISGTSSLTGSVSAGSIASTGSISASGQSMICYTNALAGSQSIPNNTVTAVTFLTNQIVSKGSAITWNPGSGTLVFNQAGYYSISVGLSWAAFPNAGGANIVQFYLLDIGPYIKASMSINQNGAPALTGSIQKQFAAGQTLTLNVLQNSSVSQTLGDGNFASFISVSQLVQ